MKRKEYLLLLAVSIIAGLIGGIMSNRIFTEKTVFAQETQQYPELLQAQELRLIDKNGKPLAALATTTDSGEPFLVIYSKKDNKYRVMVDIVDGNPRVILRDNNAQTRLVLGSAEVTSKDRETVERRPASSIVIFDKGGKLTWSAP